MQEYINRPSMLKIGTILRGIYRIDSYLSSGGFGNTYIATNIEFEECVAIKEFFMKGITQRDDNQTTVSVSNSENTNSFLEQKEKFKKEARRIRQLKNEHIVAVHDLFEENGTAYYVMDYVDGENLAERLKRTGNPMTEQEVRVILPQILNALKSVHDAGIWHLDLKPANILVDKSGNVKLIDFGASKQLNAQKGGATTSTAISYTNGYAPREQMEQNYDKFGPWTDIYALGATLYNLLTNTRPPLPTDIDDDISDDKHLALPFPASVGDEMKKLVQKLMCTNRMQRPQNIGEIQNSLIDSLIDSKSTAVQEDEETIIAHPKKDEFASKKNKKESDIQGSIRVKNNRFNKKIIWGLTVFLLLLFLILSGFYFSSRKTNNPVLIDSDSIAEIVDSIVEAPKVERMPFKSAIGECQYTGYVDDNNYPDDDKGEAFFNDGRYYKGGFIHGTLSGMNAYFTYPNGDRFEGEFRNNSFYIGKYYVKEDGSMYSGSFKNGQPEKGLWFDKNGQIIQ